MADTVVALTEPHGELKTITIAATAGNVTTNKTPGTTKRWRVLYGRITLVNDATAANRNILPSVTDGTNVLCTFLGSKNITAGQTSDMSISPLHSLASSSGGGTVLQDGTHGDIPEPLIIEGSDQFRISINNGVAGDSYSGYIRVLET